ncbi:DUF4097 family beta strand repeat-containing protein [Paenibacillus glacialis]|uniref:DUF4097 domain-containing protein n=1 Tax=Paenibacillus glacialis TaxID=494026 RepID=A0A168HNL6_9BACL|nr:DUF4097 family beta strand repeat-containing protein [Paenibacillus glacialis]OAB38372.1 hypothetical protein PGLA_19950 [Paenibacillus glacialis]
MRNSRNILRFAFVLIIVAIIGNVAMYLMGNSAFNIAELKIKKSINVEQATGISILADSGTVNIVPVKGDEIQATLQGETTKKWIKDYHLNVKEVKGEINIEITQDSRLRLFDLYTNLQLTVGIPAAKMSQLQVKTDTANIKVDSVHVTEYRLSSDTGDIDVNVTDGLFDIKSDTGDVALALEQIKYEISVVTDTGDISIEAVQEPEALRTKLEADSGKINVTFPHYKDGYIGIGGPMVKLISDTGDINMGNKK